MDRFFLTPMSREAKVSVDEVRHRFQIERRHLPGPIEAPKDEQVFGYVFSGAVILTHSVAAATSRLTRGMYFSVDSAWKIQNEGICLVITVQSYHGLTNFGGPVEDIGRLRYIDNCTDSLLLSPTKWGDPCLNLLVFPSGTRQTAHTHPSFRTGLVISGRGHCNLAEQKVPLTPGDFFYIPASLKHSFETSADDGLRVIAFHPDSDFGPTDEVHPMINRTIL